MFNLEEFKAGKAAIDRNGNKYWFVSICEDCNDDNKLVVRRDIGNITARFVNGSKSEIQEVIGDLIKMESPYDHIKEGDLVMVWNNVSCSIDAKLRKFAGVGSHGAVKTYDFKSNSIINLWNRCLTVEEYANKYLA